MTNNIFDINDVKFLEIITLAAKGEALSDYKVIDSTMKTYDEELAKLNKLKSILESR